jgi:hypothetical protein
MSNKIRRAIKVNLVGTSTTLELTKFATPMVEKQFIHLDQLPDGTWRLLFNLEGHDVQDIESFVFVREDE